MQKYIINQENKELQLQLDCKTRWNSLIVMIERFLKVKDCINKALVDLGMKEYKQENILVLEDILNILRPIEIAVKQLSRDDANILTSEGIFKFVFEKMKNTNSSLGYEMLHSLRTRIDARRNKKLISLLCYLQNGNIPTTTDDLSYCSKSIVISYAKKK